MAYINKRPILDRFHIDMVQVRNSQKWFNEQIARFAKGRITPNQLLMKDGIDSMVTRVTPGKLYAFYYFAKGHETLPYYDQFPLVFPYKAVPGGFLGLNMHYLPYRERFALFKELLKLNGGILTESTKIKYQWATVARMAKMQSAQHCIKHYLLEHVKTQYMEIGPMDMPTAMFLPVERFHGSTKEAVWNRR